MQPGAPAGTGSSMGCRETSIPTLLTCWVSQQLGAFWCLCCHRQSYHLVQRLVAARNLPQEGLCLRQGKRTGTVPPNSLSAAQQSDLHCTKICCCLFPILPAVPISWAPLPYLKTACSAETMNYGSFTPPHLGMGLVLLQCTKRELASCCLYFGEGPESFVGKRVS